MKTKIFIKIWAICIAFSLLVCISTVNTPTDEPVDSVRCDMEPGRVSQ